MNTLAEFFEQNGWKIAGELSTPERPAEVVSYDDLPLSPPAKAFLRAQYTSGIYRHQHESIARFLAGQPVCLATGTASGKSLVFQTAALHLMGMDPRAKVMAIYPMKALGNEQRERWEKALAAASIEGGAGRIDGSIAPALRLPVLEKSRVVVFTPDILHAWALSNLNAPAVRAFLQSVRLVVLDEVHAYNGVFGSNAAYLFRRIQHILNQMGTRPTWIGASATIADPRAHLRLLTGLDFSVTDARSDTSPRYPLKITLADPPAGDGLMDATVDLLGALANSDARFITFVDSRKQVELITSILSRAQREAAAEEAGAEGLERYSHLLEGLNILPYRAGYEENDRKLIQERLSSGELRGVISTSALELGIDIPHLDTCVLIGVPASATSLQQRIGRIGRHAPGSVIVVNTDDAVDRAVFNDPDQFFHRPMAEGALYLENRHVQYIHALCLARPGGEHDQARGTRPGTAPDEFHTPIAWPGQFVDLCRSERGGKTPRDLLGMRAEGKDRPNYTFPLRDVESQFKVERSQGPTSISLGSLSFSQLMREAYPGAVYYYATQPYRVTRVNTRTHQVQVRKEKRYTTRPDRLPDRVFPRLTPGGVYSARRFDDLLAVDCDVLVRESLSGVIEQRGGQEFPYPYPLPRELGYSMDQPYFNHNFFTTGVILAHPVLETPGLSLPSLAKAVYDAFLWLLPFERGDVGCAGDLLKQARPPFINEPGPFLAIFDQTYGSLRLTERLQEPGLLPLVLLNALLSARLLEPTGEDSANFSALVAICKSAWGQSGVLFEAVSGEAAPPEGAERIILPGSRGLLLRLNEEVAIQRISASSLGITYECIPVSMASSAATLMPQLTDVAEIPGESRMGWFYPADGRIEESGELNGGAQARWMERRETFARPELEKIVDVLCSGLSREEAAGFLLQFGGDPQRVNKMGTAEILRELVSANRMPELIQAIGSF